MKIAIGSDHGGYDLKGMLVALLKEKGVEVIDLGCNSRRVSRLSRFCRSCL